MQARFQRITPFLWFDDHGEEAVRLYTSIFKNSRIVSIARYGDAGAEASGRPNGTVMTIAFQLDGQEFVALNGGPHFKFTEAISLVVNCESQDEVDHFWERLSDGGDEKAQQCGCAESAPLAEEIRAGGQIARKSTVEVRPVVESAGLPTG